VTAALQAVVLAEREERMAAEAYLALFGEEHGSGDLIGRIA